MDLNPFPSRSYLTSRHQHHFVIARDQWNNREKQREVFAKKQQITSQVQTFLAVILLFCDVCLHFSEPVTRSCTSSYCSCFFGQTTSEASFSVGMWLCAWEGGSVDVLY